MSLPGFPANSRLTNCNSDPICAITPRYASTLASNPARSSRSFIIKVIRVSLSTPIPDAVSSTTLIILLPWIVSDNCSPAFSISAKVFGPLDTCSPARCVSISFLRRTSIMFSASAASPFSMYFVLNTRYPLKLSGCIPLKSPRANCSTIRLTVAGAENIVGSSSLALSTFCDAVFDFLSLDKG